MFSRRLTFSVCILFVYVVAYEYLICYKLQNLPKTSLHIGNEKDYGLESLAVKTNHSLMKNIYLLKIPKTGSTSLWTIISRHAWRNKLHFAIYKSAPLHSPRKSPIISELIPRLSDGGNYNIIADHSEFSRNDIEAVLGKDIIYIGFVRHPLTWLGSYLRFFQLLPRLGIHDDDPVRTFIEKVDTDVEWRKKHNWIIEGVRNRMARSFGIHNDSIHESLRKISQLFFVGIFEEFEKSLICMRRILDLKFKEIIHVPMRVQNYRRQFFGGALYSKYCKWSKWDCTLYEFFKRKFQATIDINTRQEAAYFKVVNNQISKLCLSLFRKFIKIQESYPKYIDYQRRITFKATKWHDGFNYSFADCLFSKLDEKTIRPLFFFSDNANINCSSLSECPITSTKLYLCKKVCEVVRSGGNVIEKLFKIKGAFLLY